MNRLKTKANVIERYWADYLYFCMLGQENKKMYYPTINGFWQWYISDGPMGVKHRSLYYLKDPVEYV